MGKVSVGMEMVWWKLRYSYLFQAKVYDCIFGPLNTGNCCLNALSFGIESSAEYA